MGNSVSLVAFLVGLCAFGLLGFAMVRTAIHGTAVPLALWVVFPLFATLWLGMAWRMTISGLYVGDAGVLVRTVLRTNVMPWQDIASFKVGPPHFMGVVLSGERLWIVRKSGREVEAPVQRGRKGAFTGPRTGQAILSKQRFDDLLAELHEQLRQNG